MFDLKSNLDHLKGIGPARLNALKSISIDNFQSLLYYFPRKYLDRNFTDKLFLKDGEFITLPVEVIDSYLAHGKRSRLIVSVKTHRGERISLVFFKGIAFFQKKLKANLSLVISGKLEYFRGLQIVHPEFEVLSDSEDTDLVHTGRIIPLYSSSEELKEIGLDSKGFRKLIRQILDLQKNGKLNIPEVLPKDILRKRKLIPRNLALEEIHFPTDSTSLKEARNRFAYEELFFFSLLLEYKKQKREKVKRVLYPYPESKSAKALIANLPFELTDDQISAIEELKKPTSRDVPSAALLQGDVGSGKTITALILALHYTDNDIQVCFVAPTEILARQHYENIMNLLGNTPFLGIELFLGKEKEKTKKEKYQRLKNGEILLAIGTHTLFQEEVKFADLGLVIFDEQHKFGVEQRESLRVKGKNPDILAMTATPIPRTLCLTLYGDLQLITIKTKPKGRIPIVTKWFEDDKREAVYNSLRKYILQGRQAFIVYPIIEESEKLDLESCITGYENLRTKVFPEFKMGLLHGKMKSAEKDSVMDKFKKNEIQILVTTTVVEVGIDVPNASILIIENSDRFGISQLHQLRGRVGRGQWESFCILISSGKISSDAVERLTALTETNDGFALSEVDLKIRGPGEVLGIRQSGLPDFKVADLQMDMPLIEQTREDSKIHSELSDLDKTEIKERFEEGRILFPN